MCINKKTNNVLFMVTIFICFFKIDAQGIIIKSIKSSKPPEIKDKRIIYTIDVSFVSCPQEYWLFYNSKKNLLICDIYGYHIKKLPDKLKSIPLIRAMNFKNMESDLALNGKRSQLYFSLESGWHYSSSLVSGEIIRLQLWKYLKPLEITKGKKNRFRKVFFITLAGIVISIFSATIISYYSN